MIWSKLITVISMLEDARKELIALSGIPAPYLGYGDESLLCRRKIEVKNND